MMDCFAESSKTVLQKLLASTPMLAKSRTLVPSGLVRVPTRSAVKGWSSPTVVLPTVVLHRVPSMENVALLTGPTPFTGMATVAPAAPPSGMAFAGPEYRTFLVVAEGSPTTTDADRVWGENPPVEWATTVSRTLDPTARRRSAVTAKVRARRAPGASAP